MLLTISTTHSPATDLSYLLHKHPQKVQSVELSAGKAHIFYSAASDSTCTINLLLDIDPVGLVRTAGPKGNGFALEQYVNDRPYVASSFMSAAIAKAFSTAMNGRCKDRPELVGVAMSLMVKIAVLPVRGGEAVLRRLFEPLGYALEIEQHPLDPIFPDWGTSRYFTVTLKNEISIQQLLTHLYVLIPVCDNDKHYWVSHQEVEKLLEKGKGWLELHPEKELITQRYLKYQKSLANKALNHMLPSDDLPVGEIELVEEEEVAKETVLRIHDIRLQSAKNELLQAGARRVADLGCGEGRLLKLLLDDKQFEYIIGMDVSYRSLEIAKDRLRLERLAPKQAERIQLIQGSLTYRDKRIEGLDAAVLVEVIEHLDAPRLASLERTVFEFARPDTAIITTPNADYNVKFPDYEEGKMRHTDHRFEWSRAEFESWGQKIASIHHYNVSFKPIGESDPEVGALSQMAIFKKTKAEETLS